MTLPLVAFSLRSIGLVSFRQTLFVKRQHQLVPTVIWNSDKAEPGRDSLCGCVFVDEGQRKKAYDFHMQISSEGKGVRLASSAPFDMEFERLVPNF